jgi:DNA-binding NarL/FixJ family response regulator
VARSRGIAALVSALAPLLDRPASTSAAGRDLTRRELEVLQHLDAGLRFKQLAAALGISETTAKWYARSLFRKLGASSRAEAVFAGRRAGLLP